MKKLLLSITLVGACLTTFAQFKGTPIITFGAQGGVNISSASYGSYIDPPDESRPSKIGFHIGGLADFNFGTFSIQPGLLYSTKGDKVTIINDTSTRVGKTILNYLEVPVNFLYKVPAGNGKVLFGGGPYLGYALSGKYKKTYNYSSGNSYSSTETVPFGSTDNDFKRTDFGLNFVAGYQLNKGLMFKLSYGLGLTNLYNLSTDTYKNQVASISVGCFF